MRTNKGRTMALLTVAAWLGACANVAPTMDSMAWKDLRGDRGGTVSRRDLSDCVEAAESRRSLVETCMRERGWVHADD